MYKREGAKKCSLGQAIFQICPLGKNLFNDKYVANRAKLSISKCHVVNLNAESPLKLILSFFNCLIHCPL